MCLLQCAFNRCNRKGRTVKENKKISYKAKFQVDHYWPQSKYPCFCISLYNLYPVCGSCNNCKNDNDLNFLLYSDQKNKIVSPFKFQLVKGVVAQYLLSRKLNDIKFTFQEPQPLLLSRLSKKFLMLREFTIPKRI
jgi:hypothetical protein